jgi:tetratricopeptide (TPR) repeat protein
MRHQTNSFEAWSLAAKAHNLFESYRLDDNAKARDLFKKAVGLDPNYAYAWSMLGWTHYIDGYHYPGHYNKNEAFKRALDIASTALEIDNSQGYAHLLLSLIYLTQGKFEEAEVAGNKAIRLEPNSSEIHAVFAITMQYLGDGEAVVALIKQAMRLDPYFPDWYWSRLGVGYRMQGQYEESVSAFKKAIEREENKKRLSYQIFLRLATTYSMMGDKENTKEHITKAKELNPKITLELWCKSQFYRDKVYTEQIREALMKAGMR